MNSFGKWIFKRNEIAWEFPGSAMVKIQCFHCWDKGSIPDQATKIPQVLQGNQKKKKKNLAKVFCKGNVQFYILASSVWKFQLPVNSSSSTWYYQGFELFFSSSHSKKCAVINMVVLPCISSIINDDKHLVMCL